MLDQGSVDRRSGRGLLRANSSLDVTVRNDGNTTIARFDVVALNNILLGSGVDVFFERGYGFSVSHAGQSESIVFGVALTPIGVGGFGKVAVFGHSAVKVNITDSSHWFGVPSKEVNGILDSAAAGPFPLVHRSGDSGLVHAVAVFPFGSSGGGGGPQLFRVANLTSSKGEAFIECNKVTEVKDDGTFTWDAMQVIHVRVYPFYPFNAAVAKQHYVVAQYIFAASIAGVWVSLYHLGWPFFIEE